MVSHATPPAGENWSNPRGSARRTHRAEARAKAAAPSRSSAPMLSPTIRKFPRPRSAPATRSWSEKIPG